MTIFRRWLIPMILACTLAHAQEAAPGPEVSTSAVSAVKVLGEQVAGGNFGYGFEKMLPRWKERLVKRQGSEAAVQRKLQSTIDQFRKSGITFVSVQPLGAPQVHGVTAGKEARNVGGKAVEVAITKQWMVLVPTISRMKMTDPQGKTHNVESKSFQVAVSDKGSNDWRFIDGASLTVEDLRSMFPTLPDTLVLPEVSMKEVP